MARASSTMYTNHQDDQSYSSFTLFTQNILENEKETILKYLDEMLNQQSHDAVITLADFGTADGGNIIIQMNCMIEHIETVKGNKQEIIIILEDQSFNNFNTLFGTVKGVIGKKAIKESDNVHLLVSGTSMYRKCLPSNSINFGFSTLALQWLSDWPVRIRAGISVYDADEEELQSIYKQAVNDWKRFLTNRGTEMKPGGYFLVVLPTDSEKKAGCILRAVTHVLKDMVDDDIITMDEFRNINVPEHTVQPIEDFLRLFDEPEINSLGLEVVSSNTFDLVTVNPIPTDFVNDRSIADHVEKIRMYVETWIHNSLFMGLSQDRSIGNKTEMIDRIFVRFQKHLIKKVWTYGLRTGFGKILFRKKYFQTEQFSSL